MVIRFRQPASTGQLVTLEHGAYKLVIAPQFGARIVSFSHDGRDIVRPTPQSVIANPKVYEFAGFPLMPYSGPLFGPGFAFGGTTYALDRTVREEPSATHGDAWIAPFRIIDQASTKLALLLDHEPQTGAFPFRFRGEVRFELSPLGLLTTLRVTSRDHRLMPAGIGFHPYFPKPDGTRLRFEAIGVWPADAPEAVTEPCGPMIEGLSFCEGPVVSGMVVDRLYEGWDGRAELEYPEGWRTVITADGALDKLQIYSAWNYPYVGVEPVSNANDGFNRMAAGVPCHGVRILEPNRSIEGSFRIFVE
jgi:aldose 1-epimerase